MKGCCIVRERTVDEKGSRGVNNKLQGGYLLKEKMDSRKKSSWYRKYVCQQDTEIDCAVYRRWVAKIKRVVSDCSNDNNNCLVTVILVIDG